MTTLSMPCRASTISIHSRRSITRLKALSPWTSTKWTLRGRTDDRGAFSRPFPARPRLHPGGTGDRYGRKPDAAARSVDGRRHLFRHRLVRIRRWGDLALRRDIAL